MALKLYGEDVENEDIVLRLQKTEGEVYLNAVNRNGDSIASILQIDNCLLTYSHAKVCLENKGVDASCLMWDDDGAIEFRENN